MIARFLITSVIVSCVGAPLSAQDSRIDAEVARVLPTVTELRHRIHENPELGNREFDTAAVVADHLSGLGFDDVRTGVAHTGVVAVLRGGTRSGRRDPSRHGRLAGHRGYRLAVLFHKAANYLGQEVGVMHACGHDIHTFSNSESRRPAAIRELAGTVFFLVRGPPPGR